VTEIRPPEIVDVEYAAAPDLEHLAYRLIDARKFDADLSDVKIIYLWKAKGGTQGGSWRMGDCKRMTGLSAHFAECDFVIWLAADHCRSLSLSAMQIEALLFHELSHISREEEDGEAPGEVVVTLSKRYHDFDGFIRELAEYGPWSFDLSQAARALQPHLPGIAAAPDPAPEVSDAVMKALRKLAPKKGSGVDSVTFSHAGDSVTIPAR